MERTDLHVHTCYCDGKDEPEDIILEAIRLGMTTLGFSSHAWAECCTGWCMSQENTEKYIHRIHELQEKYRNRIRILLGTEWDHFSEGDRSHYDYIIDSVHFLCCEGEYVPVDESAEDLRSAADRLYGGDMLPLIRQYYELVGSIADRPDPGIIGHFDLITKFSEKADLFAMEDPEYRKAWQTAADKLLAAGCTFEINTGAIARGYRTDPYPSSEILDYLKSHGASLVLNSDAHCKENLMFAFERYESLLR